MRTQTSQHFSDFDEAMMHRALTLAKRGLGHTNPNPMVGCVICKDQVVIGEGWHQAAGQAHAEIAALQQCKVSTQGATLYVTLTPCHHHGRTGPCTQAIVDAGIQRVVIATEDPNHQTQQSIAWLIDHNIAVDIGCLEKQARALNPIFNHTMMHESVYLHAKWAMSLDGKMKTHDPDDRHISQPETQLTAHYWRQYCDAILVGVQTILSDNPSLTSRYPHTGQYRHPLRMIVDPKGKTPITSTILSPKHPGKTLMICTAAAPDSWMTQVKSQGHDIWLAQTNADGHIDIAQLLVDLYPRGITSVLIEGGETVRDYCINHQLIHSCDVAIAPCFIGTRQKSMRRFHLSSCTRLHDDCLISCIT